MFFVQVLFTFTAKTEEAGTNDIANMSAGRYRNFLRLCEEWPVDKTKQGRDLGAYIRQMVSQAFKQGESSQVDERDCDRKYQSLTLLANDHFMKKYPRNPHFNASGLSAEELKEVLSSDAMRELEGENTRDKLLKQLGEKRDSATVDNNMKGHKSPEGAKKS